MKPRANRFALTIISISMGLVIGQTASAYRLPPYTITTADWDLPAEIVFARLPPSPTFSTPQRHTSVAFAFWRDVVALKHDLLTLPETQITSAALTEADLLAKEIIAALYDISQHYRILGWARLHNFAIHVGLRDRGYCYHYVEDLFAALAGKQWNSFTLTWAEACAGTRRESNALAIRHRGAPFSSGLVIDAWRSAGKPYWHRIEGDRWPWREWAGYRAP